MAVKMLDAKGNFVTVTHTTAPRFLTEGPDGGNGPALVVAEEELRFNSGKQSEGSLLGPVITGIIFVVLLLVVIAVLMVAASLLTGNHHAAAALTGNI